MTPMETALRKVLAEVELELRFRDGKVNSEESGWAFTGCRRAGLEWAQRILAGGLAGDMPAALGLTFGEPLMPGAGR